MCWFAFSSRVASALMMRSAISGRARQHRLERLAFDHQQARRRAHDRGRRARPAVEDRHLAEELARGAREHAIALADAAAIRPRRIARRTCSRRAGLLNNTLPAAKSRAKRSSPSVAVTAASSHDLSAPWRGAGCGTARASRACRCGGRRRGPAPRRSTARADQHLDVPARPRSLIRARRRGT